MRILQALLIQTGRHALWVICLLPFTFSYSVSAEPEVMLRNFPKGQLIIAGDLRCIWFSVFVADTPAHRAQGLMHIRSLQADEGMIFLYDAPTEIHMWMKNTFISLDMIFISSEGVLQQIAAQTEPLSETIISSRSTASAVLELNAGAAAYYGLASGNRIIYPNTLN